MFTRRNNSNNRNGTERIQEPKEFKCLKLLHNTSENVKSTSNNVNCSILVTTEYNKWSLLLFFIAKFGNDSPQSQASSLNITSEENDLYLKRQPPKKGKKQN